MYSFILAALGLHSCAPAFSSCSKCGPLFIVVSRLLLAVASPVVEHRLWAREFQQLQHTGSVAVMCGLSRSAVKCWQHPGLPPFCVPWHLACQDMTTEKVFRDFQKPLGRQNHPWLRITGLEQHLSRWTLENPSPMESQQIFSEKQGSKMS